ncbi:hypothetical protein CC86DRAFT_389181 [Ophiobolus disseminans]|uniref:MADS-box domain-containing protein n=1 Tax=Ophiobolus disseminans TaxID=1469910 RepID=A0A6A6ZBM6_9PLEO|nr:hypothetical protein CC86DRAFT_389181 [Ophiobolus disseminans]
MTSRRSQQESFRKRKNNFIRRGHEISDRYKVGVWICILKDNGQLYVYNSDPTRPNWPPTREQLASTYPVPVIKSREDFSSEKRAYRKISPAKPVSLLPKYLPKPPVPDYAQEDASSGKSLKRTRE